MARKHDPIRGTVAVMTMILLVGLYCIGANYASLHKRLNRVLEPNVTKCYYENDFSRQAPKISR